MMYTACISMHEYMYIDMNVFAYLCIYCRFFESLLCILIDPHNILSRLFQLGLPQFEGVCIFVCVRAYDVFVCALVLRGDYILLRKPQVAPHVQTLQITFNVHALHRLYTNMCVCVCGCVWMCVCVCVCVYTYVYIYKCICI